MHKSFFVLSLILFVSSTSSFAAQYECPDSFLGSFYGNRGAKSWEKGEYEVAEKQTRKAIKHDPECSMWHQNLGFILKDMGRHEEASQSWQRSLDLDKFWCNAFKTGSALSLGDYYVFKVEDYEKSVAYFELAAQLAEQEKIDDRSKGPIYFDLSYNYTEPDSPYYDLDKALELKQKAVKLNPGNLFYQVSAASVLVRQGKEGEVRPVLEDILHRQQQAPNPHPGVYSYLAYIYALMNDSQNSARFIETAMDIDPYQANYLLRELEGDFKNVATSEAMKPMIEKARKLQTGN